MKPIIYLAAFLLIFTSCEKVVDIDLNSADPQTVVEALIAEGQDSLVVLVSKTSDYFEEYVPTPVSNAQILLNDDNGGQWTANEVTPGYYQVDGVKPVAGRTYTFTASVDNEVSKAVSFLPDAVALDTIWFEYDDGSGFFEEGHYTYFGFQDPPGIENYYRLEISINGFQEPDIVVFDDRFVDGNYVESTFFDFPIYEGDSVVLELKSIDKELYDYYFTLNEIVQDGGQPGIAPGNPVTNFNGDIKLGYFGTYSSHKLGALLTL